MIRNSFLTLLLAVLSIVSAVAGVRPQKVRHRAGTTDVVLLTENFNKFTQGSEQSPDPTDLCLKELDWCISPSLLETPGWNGGGIYQAGGCACIYGYESGDGSGALELGYLESPKFDASACQGTFIVCFRARSVLEQDWFGVCGVPSEGKAEQKFAVIGKDWGNYEVTLNCGDKNTCVQFEPLEDACFIDDIRIIQVMGGGEIVPENKLPTPVVLPVSDYSPDSYKANWQAVAGADDYAVYDYLYHTSQTEDEEFDYINTDFSRITQGSIEEPIAPGNNNDFGMYLDEIVDRSDWLAYMPMLAEGCLAVDNGMSALMPAGIESPNLHLPQSGLPLHISVDVMSPTLTSLALYAYGEESELGDVMMDVTPTWTTHQVTVPACPDQVILELVVADSEPGYMYFDNLRVWQELPAGTVARVPYAYYETADTSCQIATLSTPQGYRHAFSVSAYQYTFDEEGDMIDYIMSDWTTPCFADGLPAEGVVRVRNSEDASGATFDLVGRQVETATTRGLYIRGGKKFLNR